MAQEVYLKLIVQDGDVDATTKKLQTLGHEVENVDTKSKKAGSSLNDGLKGAQESANNLKGGVQGVGTELINVGKAAKKGGAAMKSAFISSGIGIFIVLLGEVVENWDSIVGFITGANAKLEEQKRILKEISRELDRQKYNNELNLDLIDLQTEQDIKRAKIAGKTEEEITAIRRKGIEDRLNELRRAAADALDLERKAAIQGGEEYEKAQKKRLEIERAVSAERIKLANFDLDQQLPDSGDGDQQRRERLKAIGLPTAEDIQAEKDALIEAREELFEELFGIQKSENDRLLLEAQNLDFGLSNIDQQRMVRGQKTSDFFKTLASEEAKAKIAAAQNILGSVSALAEEGSAVAKGVAVAQATMSTYEAAVAAYAAGSSVGGPAGLVLGPLAAGLAVAAGIANVVKILKTKPIENKAPTAGGGGGGATAAATPSFNVVGTSGQNQIAQTLSERNDQPLRAYVVGSNVTSQQAADRNIQDSATIG